MLKKDSETLQKTIRLPVELVEYVENQDGKDFSKKLVNLLDDVKSGDTRRQEMLSDYEKRISEYRTRLDELLSSTCTLKQVFERLDKFCHDINRLIE